MPSFLLPQGKEFQTFQKRYIVKVTEFQHDCRAARSSAASLGSITWIFFKVLQRNNKEHAEATGKQGEKESTIL